MHFNIYANVQREKHDKFTADIYYYITTELGYARRELRPAAYGGVLLQRFVKVCMGKNGDPHCNRNFDILAMKMIYLNALLSFLLSCRFSAQSKAF